MILADKLKQLWRPAKPGNLYNNRQAGGLRDIDLPLEQELSKLFKKQKLTVCTAESCTGGYVAHLITSSLQLSPYFIGGIICYSEDVKRSLLHVTRAAIEHDAAVNEKCAVEMLKGLLQQIDASYGIAVTGFAGPNGGSAESPVGTAWVAVGNKDAYLTQKFLFYDNRAENIYAFGVAALRLLKQLIEQHAHMV